MKRIIFLILIIVPIAALGQKITFCSELLNTKDSSIVALREYWTSYVTNLKGGYDSRSFSIYWNDDEIKEGISDIVLDAIGLPSFLFGEYGELTVFDIKKVDNGYYRIRNIWSFSRNTNDKNVLAIFSVFAKKVSSSYKLFNNFYMVKLKLNHFQTDNIEYYYPNNYSFNILKANQMTELYSKISLLYGNKNKRKVTYIIGNNLDEANNFIGFDYTIYSSSSSEAAYIIKQQNIILASREDHLHEVIHTIFFSMFLKAPGLFQEGIATYYGGSVGKDYSHLIGQLKESINKNLNIDLSNFDNLNNILENGTNNFYIIGAILIDYALKIGGPKKVISLFQYSASNELSWEDPIPAIKNVLGIEQNQIDSFLKKYIQTY